MIEAMDINRNNYETFFLLCLDRELSPADMEKLEGFLKANADLQKEFTLLQQTILVPADIVFEQKELLLRKEEKRRVIPLYRFRIAAAVAVLITGSLFITLQVLKNHSAKTTGDKGIAVKNAAEKKDPVKVNSSSENRNPAREKLKADNNPVNQLKEEGVAENNKPANHRGIVENKNPEKTADQKTKEHNVAADPEEPGLAMQKSSAAWELQAAEMQTVRDQKQLTAPKGVQDPALVLATANSKVQPKTENVVLKEQDFQTDNAISVVALNDRNKSITGFFKKLTKHAPDDENIKKLRVSVFQISL
jgi:hypothetical protein